MGRWDSYKASEGGGGGKDELIPSGSHAAVCCLVANVGTHLCSYQGGDEYEVHKLIVGFEIPNERRSDGFPHVAYGEFNLPPDPGQITAKNGFRKFLEGWRGKAFATGEGLPPLDKLIGKPCMVNIAHKTSGKGNTYYVLTSASGLPKGMPTPTGTGKTFLFHYEDNQPADFPKWLPRCRGRHLEEYANASLEFGGFGDVWAKANGSKSTSHNNGSSEYGEPPGRGRNAEPVDVDDLADVPF